MNTSHPTQRSSAHYNNTALVNQGLKAERGTDPSLAEYTRNAPNTPEIRKYVQSRRYDPRCMKLDLLYYGR